MTAYQDGQAQVRKELFPPPPAGYKRGRTEHTAFVDIGLICCLVCGAVVADTELHNEWHVATTRAIVRISQAADRADVMTSVIGPKPGGAS